MDEITAKLERINLTPERPPPTPNKHKAPRPPSADEAWIHKRLVEDCEGILFVGESVNRSLPIAIAAMRGSWDNIWASSLGETCQWDMLTPEGLAPMEQILEAARTRAKDNAGNTTMTSAKILNGSLSSTSINSSTISPLHQSRISNSALAANSNEHRARNIWFQCPWSDSKSEPSSSLILQFLASAAEVPIPGDAIFLGLTANRDYCDNYKLPAVLEHAESLDYDLRPVDRYCIRRAIDLGYLHKKPGNWRIDGKLLHYHETYVFVKRYAMSGAGAQ
ncbi:hypothetical protein C8F01DRAFT_1101739, partial [Mycena amicta]